MESGLKKAADVPLFMSDESPPPPAKRLPEAGASTGISAKFPVIASQPERRKCLAWHGVSMVHAVRGKVGTKGELFPPKKLRDEVGLRPRAEVWYRTEEARLIVEPLPSLRDVLRERPDVVVAPAEVRALRSKLSREAER